MPRRSVDISVCIPTYNCEETLRICLDSIFRQTVKPKEVLVCDGGSTDKTLEILKEYPANIIATNVKGLGLARNILASSAIGKIIAWVDSDIVIPVNWLELREKIHQEHPEIDCLSNFTMMVDPKEAKERSNVPIVSKILPNPSEKFFSQRAQTIKKDVIQRVGGYDPLFEWGEEWDLQVRLSRSKAGLYCIEAPLAYHIRSKTFFKRTERFRLNNLKPRDLILAGNFTCFIFKYGPWYIKHNARTRTHFTSFLLRLWLLYSLIGTIIIPLPAFASLILAVTTNLVACKIHHKRLRLGFLLDQILKALGEHRNFFRLVIYSLRQRKARPTNFQRN